LADQLKRHAAMLPSRSHSVNQRTS
jgi:hypothetical protein